MAHTHQQKAILGAFNATIYGKVVEAVRKMKEAHDAVRKLPHTNEEGLPLVHRDNVDMHVLMDYYYHEAHIYLKALTREQEDEIHDKFPHWKNNFRNPMERS